MVPKVVFRSMTLEGYIKVIRRAYFENNGSLDVHQYLLEYYLELSEVEGYEWEVILKERIGVVFQENIFDEELSIYENMMFRGRLYSIKK